MRKGLDLHLAVKPLAGLARVALAQENPEEALAHVREILDYMEDHPAHLNRQGDPEDQQLILLPPTVPRQATVL